MEGKWGTTPSPGVGFTIYQLMCGGMGRVHCRYRRRQIVYVSVECGMSGSGAPSRDTSPDLCVPVDPSSFPRPREAEDVSCTHRVNLLKWSTVPPPLTTHLLVHPTSTRLTITFSICSPEKTTTPDSPLSSPEDPGTPGSSESTVLRVP